MIQIRQMGIGDLILFAAQILQEKKTELTLSINQKVLDEYKPSNKIDYKNFVCFYIKKLLPNIDITFTDSQEYEFFNYNFETISHSLENREVLNHFEKVFKRKKIYDDYYVLFTKSRYLNKNIFNTIEEEFFKRLNNLDKKIILLGEREIEESVEYQFIGLDHAFSIYENAKQKINSKNLIDLTIPKMGIVVPNWSKIVQDMSLIYHSNTMFMFGIGGFFCTSLFTKKLKTLSKEEVHMFSSQFGKQIFLNETDYINQIL